MWAMSASLIHGLAPSFQGLMDATAEDNQAVRGGLFEWTPAPHRGLRLELVREGGLLRIAPLLTRENL